MRDNFKKFGIIFLGAAIALLLALWVFGCTPVQTQTVQPNTGTTTGDIGQGAVVEDNDETEVENTNESTVNSTWMILGQQIIVRLFWLTLILAFMHLLINTIT